MTDRVHPSRDDAARPLAERGRRRPAGRPRGAAPLVGPAAGGPAARDALAVPGDGRQGAVPRRGRRGRHRPVRRALLVRRLPAYVDRGHAELAWPFTDDPAVRERYAAGWHPPVPAYVAWAAARVTHVLSGLARPRRPARAAVADVAADEDVHREARIFTAVTAIWLAAAGLLAAGLLVGVAGAGPGTPRPSRPRRCSSPLADHLGPARGAAVAGVLWGWARRRPGVAGAALGLGAATSPLVARAAGAAGRGRRARAARPRGVAGGRRGPRDLVVANAPAYLSSSTAWRASWQGYLHGADVGSVWLLVSRPATSTSRAARCSPRAAVLVAAWLGVVAAVGMRTRLSARGARHPGPRRDAGRQPGVRPVVRPGSAAAGRARRGALARPAGVAGARCCASRCSGGTSGGSSPRRAAATRGPTGGRAGPAGSAWRGWSRPRCCGPGRPLR